MQLLFCEKTWADSWQLRGLFRITNEIFNTLLFCKESRRLAGLGDFLESQMKYSTHNCFVKSPRQILAGLGDFLESQMKLSSHYCLPKALGRFLPA
jgi:hypothetical protein